MAIHGERFRPPLLYNYSYPSLPGLEIAVPPRQVSSSTPDLMDYYLHKALPPPPPVRTPDSNAEDYGESISLRASTKESVTISTTSADAVHTIEETRRGFLANSIDVGERQNLGDETDILELSTGVDHLKLTLPPKVVDPDSSTLSRSTYTGASKSTDGKPHKKSDSAYSFSSVSVYSQDDALENIVSGYSEWGSWAPSIASAQSPTKAEFYLQSAMYSASASELRSRNQTSEVPGDIRSRRHKSRPSASSLGAINGTREPKRVVTLDNLVTEERELLAKEIKARAARMSNQDKVDPSNTNNAFAAPNNINDPPWNMYDSLIRSLEVQPLIVTLPKKPYTTSLRSESRFSDNSSDSESGVIASARDSVISHIRSIPSAFKASHRPSMIFKEKSTTATIRIESPPHPEKDKQSMLQNASGKHPLKSPFPFLSPPPKKLHLDESSDTLPPNFARRSWDVIKHRSSLRPSQIVQSNVISNYARRGDGPDTPLPSTPSFSSPRAPGSASHKGSFLQDAMHKAMNVTKVKSKEDRRRDRLRKAIVVIGSADQTPNGDVASWL